MKHGLKKNNGKPNCEKTCYKMNKENENKFENYWGNIIVNYLDNKRTNYIGYINNNKKDEFNLFLIHMKILIINKYIIYNIYLFR